MGDGSISVDLGGNLEGIWVESEEGFGLASNPAQSGAWRASNDVIYGFRQPRIVICRRWVDGGGRRRWAGGDQMEVGILELTREA